MSSRIEPKLAVTRQEMVDYYERLRTSRYQVPPQAHAQLIKLRLEDHADMQAMLALAQSLVSRGRAGEDFARLAREFSKGPKAAEGGDWGMLPKGSFKVDAVNEALFALPVGGVSDPIADGGSVYIIKVINRSDGRTVPFTEVQNECREAVLAAKRERMIAEYVESLHERNYVAIYEENL